MITCSKVFTLGINLDQSLLIVYFLALKILGGFKLNLITGGFLSLRAINFISAQVRLLKN